MQEKYVLSIMSYQDIQYQEISYYQNNFTILGLARDMTIEGFPGTRRGSQIVPWAAEERVPELALSHGHTDEYLAYHHRTFIWRWMEIETETHIGALDLAPKAQMRRKRRENMSKEVRTTKCVSTQ